MKAKFACADFTFPLLNHDQSLRLVSLMEFKGVDIGLFEERSHLWPSREFKNVARSARALRKKLDNLGLKPADVFLQMAPDFKAFAINHPEGRRRKKARDWFQRTLDYTAGCGGKHITILPGVHFEDESLAESLARCVDELSWRVAQAKKSRLTVSVEAHVGSIAPRPALATALLKQVPGLTLTLDYTHFTRIGLPDSSVEPLVAHASHFHVRGARRGRLQERFAHNTIDYARVFKAMQKADYKGWIGIEYVWQDWEHCNECDNVAETVLFRDFFRQLAG